VLRTLRDAKQAKHKGRPIAPHHLARLFARRWHQMSQQSNEVDRLDYFGRVPKDRFLLGNGKFVTKGKFSGKDSSRDE
jgi:hypothetical protein